jgi:hypothetical protein
MRNESATSAAARGFGFVQVGVVGAALCAALFATPLPQETRPVEKDAPSSRSAAAAGLLEETLFETSGLVLRRPKGMTKQDAFEGFGDVEVGASIMATRMPAPFSEFRRAWTVANMKAQGWTNVSVSQLELDGRSGLELSFRQTAEGVDYEKYGATFGDGEQTWIVMAAAPADAPEDYRARLKACVLGARVHKGAADSRPTLAASRPSAWTFDVDAPKGFSKAKEVSGMRIFTEGGVFPLASPGDPMFIVGRSVGKAPKMSQREFAERRVRSVAGVKGVVPRGTTPVVIAGASGFESVADGTDEDSGDAVTIFQVLLFEEGGYVVMQGLVRTTREAELLQPFRDASKTFKNL